MKLQQFMKQQCTVLCICSQAITDACVVYICSGTMTETQVLLSLGHNQQIDRHGFVLPEGGPSISSPGASSKPDSSSASGSSHRRCQRHERKWRKMLGHSGADFSNYLAKHPDKVKCRARKGIPDSLRGLAWQLLSGQSIDGPTCRIKILYGGAGMGD